MIFNFSLLSQFHAPNRCISCVFNRNSICDNPNSKLYYRGFTSAVSYCRSFQSKDYISPTVELWSIEKIISLSDILGITINPQLSLF